MTQEILPTLPDPDREPEPMAELVLDPENLPPPLAFPPYRARRSGGTA